MSRFFALLRYSLLLISTLLLSQVSPIAFGQAHSQLLTLSDETRSENTASSNRASGSTSENNSDSSGDLPHLNQRYEPSEIITITAQRSEQALTEQTHTIAVINENEIDNINASHVQQVLNRISGVNFHQNSGQEYLPSIRSPVLTGAGACGSFLMMENGIPLRPNSFCNVNELFEAHSELAQRIEVLKGPVSAFYGSNGLHGAVNVIEPANFTTPDNVQLTLGEHQYVDVGVQLASDSFAVAASISHDGGFRDESGYNQQKVSLQHQTQLAGSQVNSYLSVFNLDQNTAGYLIGKDSYLDETLSRSNPNPEAYRKATGLRISQRYTFENDFIFKPYARLSEMEFLQHFLPGKPLETSAQASVGFQSQYPIVLASNHLLNIGLDSEYAAIDMLQAQHNQTQGSAFLQATIPQGKHYDYSVNIFTAAPFVELNSQLNESVRFVAGARMEYSYFDYNNKMNAGQVDENGQTCGFGGCRYVRPKSRHDNFLILSPKLGLVYQATAQQHFTVNLTNGFRMPQTSELYRLQRGQQVADLSPEKMNGIEGSWQYRYQGFQFDSHAYVYQKENAIIRNTDFYMVNGAKTSHKGVEFSVSNEFFQSFSTLINATYSVHQYENNPGISGDDIVGNDIDSAPRVLGNVFFTYQKNKWWVELHGQYSGEYYLDAENHFQYPGHFIANARFSYQLLSRLKVSAQLLNLADTRYATRADYTRFTQERYFPGEGRNFKISANYQF